MSILREKTIQEIMIMLDNSIFTRQAFNASFNNDDGDIVRIEFRDIPEFKFTITSSGPNKWRVFESPGDTFKDGESVVYEGFYSCTRNIEDWIGRVLEECTFSETGTEAIFEQMRKNLNKYSDNLPEPDKPFDEEDSIIWQQKLDDLVKIIESLQKGKKIQQDKLDAFIDVVEELKQDVEKLKSKINTLPKRTWVKAAGNKILDSLVKLANTKAGKAIVEGTFKGFLGNGGGG